MAILKGRYPIAHGVGIFFVVFILSAIVQRDSWFFTTKTYSWSIACISLVAGLALYFYALSGIKSGSMDYVPFHRWFTVWFGHTAFPLVIFAVFHDSTTINLKFLATENHSEMVKIKDKSRGGGKTCDYKFYFVEYSGYGSSFCVEERIWNRGFAGARMRLSGKRNAIAFYVNEARFEN